jgi:hypothetical protein
VEYIWLSDYDGMRDFHQAKHSGAFLVGVFAAVIA